MQHDAQERGIDLNSAVILDETELPEFVHEEIDPRARCADHLGERFLRYFGEHSVGFVFFTVTGKQEKSAGEPLLAGVEQLIDQILFNSNVPRQHETDEAI